MVSFLKQYCSPEWVEFIDAHKSEIVFKTNETIFGEGDNAKGLYILKNGKVKVVTKETDNKQRIIRLAASGDILGHRGFGGDWKYPISAITLTPTTVTFIPLKAFNVLVKTNVTFTYQLMMFFAEELRRSEEKITSAPVKTRLAKAILLNHAVFGETENEPGLLSFTLSRKDFASKSGTTYETVIRVFSELNKLEVIKIEGKNIRILDIKALEKIAKGT